jgi:hypothetical protein
VLMDGVGSTSNWPHHGKGCLIYQPLVELKDIIDHQPLEVFENDFNVENVHVNLLLVVVVLFS